MLNLEILSSKLFLNTGTFLEFMMQHRKLKSLNLRNRKSKGIVDHFQIFTNEINHTMSSQNTCRI